MFLNPLIGQYLNFVRNLLVMLSVSYAGKNLYSAGKTIEVLRGGAFGANRGSVLAHCAPPSMGNFELGNRSDE